MQFFIAASVLLAASIVLLLHQYWTRAFADDTPADSAAQAEPAEQGLKAA